MGLTDLAAPKPWSLVLGLGDPDFDRVRSTPAILGLAAGEDQTSTRRPTR
jgi:hypothetical protein